MRTSPQGIIALAAHEGLVPAPYKDSVGVWTYGVGHTRGAGEPDPAKMPMAMPQGTAAMNNEIAKAIKLFAEDLEKYEARVNDAVKVPVSQHEFDALVSFDFNTGGIYKAKLTASLNRQDRASAARQFMGWLKPIEIRGRRTAEMNLFETGKYPDTSVPIWGTNGNGRLTGIVSQMRPSELISYLSEVRSIAPQPITNDDFVFRQPPSVLPPPAQSHVVPIPQEVHDLIEETSGDGSWTKRLNTFLKYLGEFGIGVPALMAFIGDLDPLVAGAIVVAAGAVLGVSIYVNNSRDRKAQKAFKAKIAIENAT